MLPSFVIRFPEPLGIFNGLPPPVQGMPQPTPQVIPRLLPELTLLLRHSADAGGAMSEARTTMATVVYKSFLIFISKLLLVPVY